MFQVRNVFKTSAHQPNQLTKRQHKQIKGLAQHLVNECRSRRALDRTGPHSVGPGDLIALAFGQRIQLDQTQALRYLECARVTEGLDADIIASPDDADDQQQNETGTEETHARPSLICAPPAADAPTAAPAASTDGTATSHQLHA